MERVTAGHIVKDVLALYPETRRVFAAFDLDLCCGGVHPIGVAARAKGVALEELLAQLNAAVELMLRKSFIMKGGAIVLAAVLSGSWASALTAGDSKIQVAEDMGPAVIDVSNYPPQYQKTYRDIFLPIFKFIGNPARVVNSPIIEMDAAQEALERKVRPDLFADPQTAQITRDGWKKWAQKIYMRPACCGACIVLTKRQAKELWLFMVYDSIQRKTGPKAPDWIRFRKNLIERFAQVQEQRRELAASARTATAVAQRRIK